MQNVLHLHELFKKKKKIVENLKAGRQNHAHIQSICVALNETPLMTHAISHAPISQQNLNPIA